VAVVVGGVVGVLWGCGLGDSFGWGFVSLGRALW